MQEENTAILGIFLEIKNKENYMKLVKGNDQTNASNQ